MLNRSRIRAIQGGFSFVPHRFLSDGFIKRLGPGELLLYLFLIIVSDGYGLSYYGSPAICRMLKMTRCQLEHYRQILIDEDLIVVAPPLVPSVGIARKADGKNSSSRRFSIVISSFSIFFFRAD